MFVILCGYESYIGTTDTDQGGAPDDVRATGDDVVYLLRSANAFFPQARLAPGDVVSTWAGLRPLLAPAHSGAASEVSREHRVVDSPRGHITIAVGNLTTFCVMDQEVCERAADLRFDITGHP